MKREGGGDRSKGEGGERTCQGKKDSVLRALTKNPRKEMAVPHRHDSASSPSASTSRPPLACISSALLLVIWGGREGGGGVSLQLTRRQNRFQATKTRPPAGSLACLPPACFKCRARTLSRLSHFMKHANMVHTYRICSSQPSISLRKLRKTNGRTDARRR